jgi:hydroxymethylglutaryl-CoA reductase
MERSSRIEGFYKLSLEERLRVVKEFAGLTEEEAQALSGSSGLGAGAADKMVENALGTFAMPIGVATNFLVNGREYLVPMVIEEPSVVAAASNAAKMARDRGGFKASSTAPVMIGQIQVTGVQDPQRAAGLVEKEKARILKLANEQDPMLVSLGGGARDLEARVIQTIHGPQVVVHLKVDVRDAMGANAVNTMAEVAAPLVEEITGGRVYLRILSNLAVFRVARSEAVWSKEAIGGEAVVDGVVEAYAFAEADPFRCATHNKGIMNGIDAVIIATGNDWRAIEAGAHSYATLAGGYKPLTKFEKTAEGNLKGSIEVPMAVGLVGGATKVHPGAKACVRLLGIRSANELAEVVASVGLAQNLAALRALATVGIQKGHMSLHARNIVASVGCPPELMDEAVEIIVRERKIRMDRAKEVVDDLRKRRGPG